MSDQQNKTGKRKKPWYRLRNVLLFFLSVIVLSLGWIVMEVWPVYTAEPNIAVNYQKQFREFVEKDQGIDSEQADRAWEILTDTLKRAEALCMEFEENFVKTDFVPRDEYDQCELDFQIVYSGSSIPQNIDQEKQALEMLRSEGVFDQLAQFAELAPGLRPAIQNKTMLEFNLPQLSQARLMAKVRAATMHLALLDGDQEQIARAFDETLALAQTFSYQQLLISHLVSQAIDALILRELRFELIESEFDESTCILLSKSLDQRTLASAKTIIKGEHTRFLNTVQHLYSDDGNGDGYLSPNIEDGYLGPNTDSSALLNFFYAMSSRFDSAKRKESNQSISMKMPSLS